MTTQPLAKAKKDHQSNTQEFLSGKLAQVDIGRIEKEIKGLWKSASLPDESGTEQGSVTRACAMNLILFSEDDDAEKAAGDVLDDISSRHPCRAILAIARPSLRPSLEAWVSARCHLSDSKSQKQICCEQITVRSQGTSLEELASVVLPLVIADLPVFMWWRSTSINLHRVRPFLAKVDEIILDSGKHGRGPDFFADVVTIIGAYDKARSTQVVVSDLNWRRCLLWREAIALTFDEKHGEVPLSALKQIKSIDLAYVWSKGAPSNQAILYAGWLSSKLDWKLDKAAKTGDGVKLQFKSDGSIIEINLRGVECDTDTGDLCSVQIQFNDATLPFIKIIRDAGAPGVQVHCASSLTDDSSAQKEMFRVNQASESRLIDLELETCDRDSTLEAAYRSAAEIAAALKG
jgi:glucose-6-phosphate dehydrogenase assembly protein OpcA